MSTISPSQSNAGDLITAASINNPINQIASVINGGIDSTNIADGALTSAKLAGIKVTRQNDTTNITEATARILTGWGVMVTPSGGNSWFETVTFGSAFSSPPIILISAGGDTLNTANTTYGQGGSLNVAGWTSKAHSITASNFVAYLSTSTGSNITTSGTVFYQWIAIGI